MARPQERKGRFWILAVVFTLGYGAIGYRLVDLHALRRPELLSELESSRHRLIVEYPRRGDILDANGELLATSKTFLEVGVDRYEIRGDELSRLPFIASHLGVSLSSVEEAFGVAEGRLPSNPKSLKPRWKLIRRHVETKDFQAVKELKLRCLTSTPNYERVYPKNGLAAHVVGFVRKDGVPAMGVENSYDFFLSGEKGWKESEVGGVNGEMAQFRRRHFASHDGMNIVLTIDSYVQHAVELELQSIRRKFDPISASIIVSDPYTGDILALGNYPGFDPNRYSKSAVSDHRNRALTDIIEPGSTFKIVAATAALEVGVVAEDTLIDCSIPEVVMPDGYRLELPKDDHPMGILTVAQVISKSSNRGAAHLGMRLGNDEFHDWVTRYGFGEYSGLDLGSESRGVLNPVRKWDRLTLSRMTMGHAIAVTPMQLHMATATLANGGVLMKPRIVSKIVDFEGEEIVEFGPVPRRKVISRRTANKVASFLEEAASGHGTASLASVPGYSVAGKTGTSQKIVNGRYSNDLHVGSFTGFLPANKPQVVITVVVDGAKVTSGSGVAYGNVVAAPSFREIAKKLIPHYAISPNEESREIAYRDQWDFIQRGY